MKIWKNKFLKQMIILITIIFVLITTFVPSKVYATKSKDTWLEDLFSKIGNSAATAIGFSRGLSGDSDWGLENIPGNLLKELGYLFVALGDIGMAAMQVTLLGDSNFWIGTMISNQNDNLEDKSSWLYADQSDVDALLDGRVEDARGSMLIVASDKGLKNGVFQSHWKVPNILFSPENIFSNKIAALDANYINPHKYTAVRDSEEAESEAISFAESISPTIASWYRAFRNIAIVGLLSVLVYIGIRIVIGTVSEKARYKERLQDWFIALCMVFFMHFIMAGIMMLAEKITDLFSNAINSGIIISVDDGTIFKTTFTGYIRFAAQSDAWTEAIGYAIMYLIIVGITLRYTFIYMKRALYLAFFTMIAPLVALTYPLDRIKDGNSQAFDTWIKEYFINAIIQPVHLVLYCALVGAAMSLVVKNPIYGIVALLFMSTAESWIKKMFKINEAKLTSDSLGDVALLGSILGIGSKVAGGLVNAGVTVGSAVASGGIGAVAGGIKSSVLSAPFRAPGAVAGAVGGVANRIIGAQGNSVEDDVNIDVNVNQNDENSPDGGDIQEARNNVSEEKIKEIQQKEKREKTDVEKAKMYETPNAKKQQNENANTNYTKGGVDDFVSQNQKDGKDDKSSGNNKTSTESVSNIDEGVNSNSLNASGEKVEDVSTRKNSAYEDKKLKAEKIDSIKKKDAAEDIKDLINKGISGAAGMASGAFVGAFMSGATGENKMMMATPLGGASFGAKVASGIIQTGDTKINNNIKILVNEAGIEDKNIIKNTAQIAEKENWSSAKMQLVAQIAEKYPDLKFDEKAKEDVKKLLKENGVKSDNLIKKALNDIYKVQTKIERINDKDKVDKSKIEKWK